MKKVCIILMAVCLMAIGGCGEDEDTPEGHILSLIEDFEKEKGYDLAPNIEEVKKDIEYDKTNDNIGVTVRTSQGASFFVISQSGGILSFGIDSDLNDEAYLSDAFDYWVGDVIGIKPDKDFQSLKKIGSDGYVTDNGIYIVDLGSEPGTIGFFK